jgi:hypothetical protein
MNYVNVQMCQHLVQRNTSIFIRYETDYSLSKNVSYTNSPAQFYCYNSVTALAQ